MKCSHFSYLYTKIIKDYDNYLNFIYRLNKFIEAKLG